MLMIGSACSRTPDHARHIPSDALLVAGINTRELGREIAWDALSDNELFRKLKERTRQTAPAEALSKLEHAGIRFSSTIYLYLRTDHRYDGALQTTLLVPLSDATAWEAYVQRAFPGVPVHQRDGYREILVEDEAIVGWNNKLLVVMNVVNVQPATDPGYPVVVDTQKTSAGMAGLFLTSRQKGVTADERFRKLEQTGHDLTLWINYDAAMAHTMGSGLTGLATMSIAGALWRGAVLTTGIDFERGRIRGTLKYYVPEALQDVYRNFGDAGVDKDMTDRIPPHHLHLLAGGRIPVDGIQQLLDQTGLSSITALALIGSGLTTDQVLHAFAGDVVLAVNNFNPAPRDTGVNVPMSFLCAFKIGRKDAFDKLISFAIAEKILIPGKQDHTYTIHNKDIPAAMLTVDQKYAVISTTYASAQDWLHMKSGKQQLPAPAIKTISGHAAGVYVDIAATDTAITSRISTSLPSVKELLRDARFNTLPFKDGACNAHMEITFIKNKESSLLQLLDFLLRKSES